MKKEKIDWVMFIVICIQMAIIIGLFVLYNKEVTNRQNYIQAKDHIINEQQELIEYQKEKIFDLCIQNMTLQDSCWHLYNNNLNKKK